MNDPSYEVAWREGLAEVRLTCGKANALNPRSLAAITGALDEVEAADVRAVVVTGYERFFSSGLDLVTLYELDRPAMEAFVREFDRVMLRVFAFPRPVVAAVNGHAIAGGCILALACDARLVARGDGRIGLNEIQLGLPFPGSALEIARHAIPAQSLDSVLYGGSLYTPEEALACGLVDGVADRSVVAEASEVAGRLGERPGSALRTLKASLKAPALRRAAETLDPLRQAFVEAWFSADARRLIGEARARLTCSRWSAPAPLPPCGREKGGAGEVGPTLAGA